MAYLPTELEPGLLRPTVGSARLVPLAPSLAAGLVSVPVTVDASNVREGNRPATLGGYLIRLEFDSSAVQFVEAVGGSDDGFREAPVFTKAGPSGRAAPTIRVTALHRTGKGSAGIVNLCVLRFRELTRGGASSIRVRFEGLASTVQGNNESGFGAQPIPIDASSTK